VEYGSNKEFTEKVHGGVLLLNRYKATILGKFPYKYKACDCRDIIAGQDKRHVNLSYDRPSIRELILNHKKGAQYNLSNREIKARVDRNIDAIKNLIEQHGDGRKLRRFLYELIEFNLVTGKKEDVVKTLCNLAETALTAYDIEFAAELAEHAFLLNVEDHYIWTTKAKTLKYKGDFVESLAIYDNAIRRFPGEVVPRNGRAEVLKELGRFDEALNAFSETIESFPNDAVARNAKASLLTILDRFNEARALLSVENPKSKNEWICHHIIAMSYLKEENLDEAIQRLKYGLDNAPQKEKAYYSSALSCAFMKKKKYEEAVRYLEPIIGVLNFQQGQKRLVLLAHAYAGLHNISKAKNTLTGSILASAKNKHVINIKYGLSRLYNLDIEEQPDMLPSNLSELENLETPEDIEHFVEDEEFKMVQIPLQEFKLAA
jgi:tetratricopeptide (TPR) repeat protein